MSPIYGGVVSIDRLPTTVGGLWLCGLRDVGDDPEAVLSWADASTMVCLNQVGEIERRSVAYLAWLLEHNGGRALWYPIRNFSAPGADTMLPFLRMIVTRIEAGESVVMHCAMGQGRAGTTAVCVLIMLGASREGALATVAAHRIGGGPGEPSQWRLVDQVAARHNRS
jgi:protein-tyrosine phosphatase